MSSSLSPSRKRKRRGGARHLRKLKIDHFEILNAPMQDRLRLYRENESRDGVSQVALEWAEEMQRVQDLYDVLSNLEPDSPTLTDATRTTLRALAATLDTASTAAWVKHTRLRDAVKPNSPESMRSFLRQSWIIVCRYSVMVAQVVDMLRKERGYEVWPSELLVMAGNFTYVRTMGKYRRVLDLSPNACIGAYSIRVFMYAMSLLCESLDAYGWTPSAGAYMRALFLRYALAVHLPEEWAANDTDHGQWAGEVPRRQVDDEEDTMDVEEAEEEEEEEDDAGVLVLHVPADPLLAPALLRSSFLDTGERLFFHHLWRSHALSNFWAARLEQPFDVPHHHVLAHWRLKHGLPAFKAIMEHVLKDDMLKHAIATALGNFYATRLLWPGEREQMLFEYPKEADEGDPYNILFRLRIDHFKRMQQTLHFDDPLQYVKDYVAQEELLSHYTLTLTVNPNTPKEKQPKEERWVEVDVTRNRLGPDHERVLLLLFEIVFDMRIKAVTNNQVHSVFARHAYVDDRSLDGARGRPPFSQRHLMQRTQAQSGWPGFTALWYNYGIASGGVFQITPHLVDALAMWYSLARHHTPHSAQILATTPFCKSAMWRAFEMPQDHMH